MLGLLYTGLSRSSCVVCAFCVSLSQPYIYIYVRVCLSLFLFVFGFFFLFFSFPSVRACVRACVRARVCVCKKTNTEGTDSSKVLCFDGLCMYILFYICVWSHFVDLT